MTAPGRSQRFPDVAAAEWVKLRSVRSTYWTAAIAVLATVVLAGLLCARYAGSYDTLRPDDRESDLARFSLSGIFLAQLAFGALGVLTATSEYTSGTIRATFAAVPRRRLVLAAKGCVLAATALAAGELLSFGAFGVGQAILGTRGLGVSLAAPGVARAVIGGGAYLTAVGLLGLGFGTLVRHTAGALCALFAALFAGSVIADLLPTAWRNTVIEYMPANAGSQILTVVGGGDALSPAAGFGLFCFYTAAVLAAAAVLLARRDT